MARIYSFIRASEHRRLKTIAQQAAAAKPSPDELEIVDLFRQLDTDQRRLLLQLTRSLRDHQ